MSTKVFTIEGRLGADPVLKVIPVGKSVCNFSIAVNEDWIDAENIKQKKVTWHNVECWDKNAISCNENLKKGSKVSVTGPLKIDNWQDKEGKERFTKFIMAREIKFQTSTEVDAPVSASY
ncbi:MAG: single-stranded DNA-binding protein [Bacteriovorax sp.]|nr:single-stranded DNA-binding protein [Bacteriovorax sp.]